MKQGTNFHLGRILAHKENFSFFIKQQMKLAVLLIEERLDTNLQVLKMQISLPGFGDVSIAQLAWKCQNAM